MTVKLKRASEKDKKPTILTSEIPENYRGFSNLILTILVEGLVKGASFHASRDGRTFYADNWDGPMPMVGKPLSVEIRKIETYSTLF